jgi:hypothetical protein
MRAVNASEVLRAARGLTSAFLQWSPTIAGVEVVDDPRAMPGAKWFSGAKLNYAENLLRHGAPDAPAERRDARPCCSRGSSGASTGDARRGRCERAARARARARGHGLAPRA